MTQEGDSAMKKVFYCPACGYVGAAEENEDHLCPKCSQRILYNTGMERDAYVALSPEEKAAASARWQGECVRQPGSAPAALAVSGGNRIAAMLKIIGIIVYVLAGICGIILFIDEAAVGILVLISGLISGTMFLGFGEIVRLLDVISKKN
jgi:predicted RNA-binding Zn-ribbon protein involved in translation (DUF1610 family)